MPAYVEYTIYGPSDKAAKQRPEDSLPGIDMGTFVLDNLTNSAPTLSAAFPTGADSIVVHTNNVARIAIGTAPVAGNGSVGAKTRLISGGSDWIPSYHFSVRAGQKISAILAN